MSMVSPHLVLPVSARDHVAGPATAPVTLLEYGDYECPACGAAYPIVQQVRQRWHIHGSRTSVSGQAGAV